jgi:hypothetical protein
MRFLPTDASIPDKFWKQLLPDIQILLRKTKVLRPWNEDCLDLISNLSYVVEDAKDEHKKPLFADLLPQIYISPNYTYADLSMLSEVGFHMLNDGQCVRLAQSDLSLKTESRMKGPLTSESWHKKAAKLLKCVLDFENCVNDVRDLPLIPLHDGSWTSISQGSVYYREDEDSDAIVPGDLGLRLFSAKSIANTDRLSLFSKLGVEHPDSGLVFDLIRKAYRSGRSISLISSVEHITYFFWKRSEKNSHWPEGLRLYDKFGQSFSHSYNDFYFPTLGPFGVQELFMQRKVKTGSLERWTLPFFMAIINPAYLKAVPDSAVNHGCSFRDFLHSELKIRHSPPLLRRRFQPLFLSAEFSYLISERPGMVVGVLRKYWSEYEKLITPEILTELQEIDLLSSNKAVLLLNEMFLPLPALIRVCEELEMADSFPFLHIPHELRQVPVEEWKFLHPLGLVIDHDLDFYLAVLKCFHDGVYKNWGIHHPDNMRKVIFIYKAICTQFNEKNLIIL